MKVEEQHRSWGGRRSGSGRKRKQSAKPTHVDAQEKSDPIIPQGLTGAKLAEFLEQLALETLATVAVAGASEAARVAASKEMLDRARGKAGPAKPPENDQADLADHWGELLSPGASAERAN
ncbi:hypothetical protein ABIB90_000523 [Bradyrhizobium sp. JR4.1]|uniref:hypothetical protein n=1 Tax=Bradyrhizobium sp. JR4.1 TaxID=3156372 RepID=UPI003399A61A